MNLHSHKSSVAKAVPDLSSTEQDSTTPNDIIEILDRTVSPKGVSLQVKERNGTIAKVAESRVKAGHEKYKYMCDKWLQKTRRN